MLLNIDGEKTARMREGVGGVHGTLRFDVEASKMCRKRKGLAGMRLGSRTFPCPSSFEPGRQRREEGFIAGRLQKAPQKQMLNGSLGVSRLTNKTVGGKLANALREQHFLAQYSMVNIYPHQREGSKMPREHITFYSLGDSPPFIQTEQLVWRCD